VTTKVAMKRLKQASDQRRQKTSDQRRQKRVADARRQKRVADARREKGLQLTKLYLDKAALGALLELARRYGYQELAESKAGKLDEASALVSFCLRYVVAKYNDSGQISKKCQEYYQIQQTAIHLKENAPVKRNAPAENINLYIANELNKLKLRTKSMINNLNMLPNSLIVGVRLR
jgi:hypothetical protein